MKTTMLLMICLLMSPLQAEEATKISEDTAKRDAELRIEIESIQSEMLKLSRRLTALKSKLEGLPPNPIPTGEVIVNVLPSGNVFVDGEEYTKEVLMKKLKAISAANANSGVRIRGNGKVAYQQVVDIIALCQQAGIWNISFATSKKK